MMTATLPGYTGRVIAEGDHTVSYSAFSTALILALGDRDVRRVIGTGGMISEVVQRMH